MYASQTGGLHHRNGKGAKGSNEEADDSRVPGYEAVPPPEVRCFPEYLRSAGYYATNNVKQDYQFVAPPTVWDESSGRAHYRNRAKGQPFFAVFNNVWTHESQVFRDAPKRSTVVKPADVPVPPYYPDTEEVRRTLAQAYNNLVAFDGWVGEKLNELEKSGELDRTIIFLFSDHGVGLPRGKRNSYDSGLRVPLVIRFPDKSRAGETDERLISFIDFAPTVLSLANIRPPTHLRGHPFLGEFKVDPPTYAFSTQDRMDGVMDTVRSATDGRYRYILNLMPQVPHLPRTAYREKQEIMRDLNALRTNGQATPQQWQMVSKEKPREEFYDSQVDPHNVTNIIDVAEHADRIKAMRAAAADWMASTNDLGLIQPEATMVKEKLWPPDGVQPVTAAPHASLAPAAEGKATLTVACDTEGASIGYRRKGESSWRVYAGPVAVEAGAEYEMVAHRIGFKRSAVEPVSPQS
jgi:N-sulfoglucosamine sulfohydrolase